jgi:hypothetical protein
MNVFEEPKRVDFKRSRKNREPFSKEVPKHLYTVIVSNNRQQKKVAENKPEEDIEIGLPPQPTAYLRYPDYDWL